MHNFKQVVSFTGEGVQSFCTKIYFPNGKIFFTEMLSDDEKKARKKGYRYEACEYYGKRSHALNDDIHALMLRGNPFQIDNINAKFFSEDLASIEEAREFLDE